ncbi:hypothetical protein GCM10009087_01240 [Sphingomonas oligophenolica]|uniref:Uncharacterized protein n=1 Tax=Sphingomonas oligophenolica TaxID=301154 RepID=A0ABU9Y149_9SPHN
MSTALSHQHIVIELVRDAAFSTHLAGKIADAVIAARWGRRPRRYADYLATARIRQSGAGFASPLLAVTDEQLARADADIGWRLDPAGRAAAKAARDAEFGAAPFRLTAYGIERFCRES